MNNMDENIYVKREKNITVEGSKVSPLGGDFEGSNVRASIPTPSVEL